MTAPATWDYDRELLALYVSAKAGVDGLTGRQAAEAARVSHSTLWRAQAGQTIAAGNLLALARWLGCDPFELLVDPATGARVAPGPGPDRAACVAMVAAFHDKHGLKQSRDQVVGGAVPDQVGDAP
jgi:IS5 family transposase